MLERNPRFYCQRSADERALLAATGRLFRQPGVGTPLCAVLDAADLDAPRMQRLAAWPNLSETVFLLTPGAGADYRIRIFTPKGELPFAGHHSVGAAWAAVELGLATPRDGVLIQQCDAGLLPVRINTHADGRHALGKQSACRRRDTVPPPPRDEPATGCKR
ncbi:PhzF family phenazine biosynthesis protein [Xanthomonas sacchari]